MQDISVTNPLSRKVGIALFLAIIIALQSFTTFIRPGLIPITLTLPIIMIGAVLYGAKNAAVLGAGFGFIVMMSGITGAAPLSTLLWSINPAIMILGTVGRGIAVGLITGFVYWLVSKKRTWAGIVSAAVIAPVVNTGVFLGVMVLFFQSALPENATTFFALFGAWVGVNFAIELLVNIAVVPWVVNIAMIVKKSN